MPASSGYFNTPPATERELEIVKGILLLSGITPDVRNPALGVELSPSRPDDYVFETKRTMILVWLSASITIMTLVTGSRLFLRWYIARLKWGLDDWIMVPALCLAVTYPAIQIAMVIYGGCGKHIFDVSYVEYYNYKWLASLAQIDFFVCVGLVKMSITAFNIRLTSVSSRKAKIINWTFMTLCGLYTIAAFFFNIFQCMPVVASFDLLAVARYGSPPTCVEISTMNTVLRVINIFTDYCLLALPVVVIWQVQMSWTKKLRLFAALGVGALACIGSVMTLVAKFQLKSDALWNYTGILGWSLVELTVGVLTASLPTFAFLLPSSKNSSGQRYAQSNRGATGNNTFRSARHYGPDSDTVGIVRTTEIDIEMSRRPSSELESPTHFKI